MQNDLISQAGQMQTMNQVDCIVLGPLIQEVLHPFLHHRRIYSMAVSHITIGFAFVSTILLLLHHGVKKRKQQRVGIRDCAANWTISGSDAAMHKLNHIGPTPPPDLFM
jgi:dipeptide/tripeptide permease